MKKTFIPGSEYNLDFLNKTKIKVDAVNLAGKKALVSAPSRIHISLLDDSRVELAKPGGGGIALAVDILNTEVEISVIEGGKDKIEKEFNSIRHLVMVFKKALKLEQISFAVRVIKRNENHIGLGSNATQLIAVAAGINELLGRPFNNRELRFIIGHNYTEDVSGKNIVSRGYETGCACVTSLYGGLSLLSDSMEIVENMAIPPNYKIMVFLPVKKYISKKDVLRTYDGEEKVFDYGKKFWPLLTATAYKVFYDFIPAMKCGDIAKIGEIIYDLNFMMGTIGTIRGRYSVSYYGLFEKIKGMGGIITGISSTGPLVYVMADKIVLEKIKKEIKGDIEKIIGIGSVGNGMKIKIDGKEISYSFPRTVCY